MSYESGSPASIFAVDDGLGIDRQSGFGGPVAKHVTASAGFPGAIGGDDNGRQFGYFSGNVIREWDPDVPNTFLNQFPSPSPTELAGMAFDGEHLYVSDLAGNLFTLDPDDGTVINTVTVPDGALTGLGADIVVIGPPPGGTPGDLFAVDSDFDQLFELDPATGAGTLVGSTLSGGLSTPAGLAFNGTDLITIDLSGGELFRLDRSTGAPTLIATTAISGWQGLAADPTDGGQLYGITQDDVLYRIGLAGSTTTIGTNVGDLIAGLEFDGSGNLWAVEFFTGVFGTIDLNTGAFTAQGTTLTGFQGIDFDHTGQMFGQTTNSDSLYEIDTVTGMATLIGPNATVFVKGLGFDGTPGTPVVGLGGHVNSSTFPDLGEAAAAAGVDDFTALTPEQLDAAVDDAGGTVGAFDGDAVPGFELAPTELITNGDFESGDLTGWTVTNVGNSSGNWTINNGSFDPPGPGGPLAPISGSYDAVSYSSGYGVRILSEPIVVPTNITSATLSWSDRIRNYASEFSDPDQEWRVLILDSGGSLIQEVYSTDPGDPLEQIGPNHRSFDLTSLLQSLEDDTIRISFEEQDSLYFFNATLDDVSLLVTTGEGPTGLDIDEYLLDLTGKAGQPIDIAMSYDVSGGGGGGEGQQGQITTMFASNNQFDGNMFDVTTFDNALTITDLDVNLVSGTHTLELYTKSGTYQGFETNPGAWTLVSTATVTSAGIDNPTPFDVTDFVLSSESVTGFYVTTTGTRMRYTNGANSYSNADIRLDLGVGKSYPFGSTFSPRTWNGTICYTVGGGGSGADPTLELLAPDGTTVLATGADVADNFDLGILDFVVPADGVYTVRVTSGRAGDYGIVVTDPLIFDTEPNDGPPSLRSLDGVDDALGYLGEHSDLDAYSVTLAAGLPVAFGTQTPLDNLAGTLNLLDPGLQVLDPDGIEVAADSSSGPDGKNAGVLVIPAVDGVYTVVVRTDPGSGAGEYLLTTLHPPVVDDDDLDLSADSIWENDSVTLTGSFVDADVDDIHTVLVDWGDGQASAAAVDQQNRTFTATHQYLDDGPNPGGSPSFVYTIEVTVTDLAGLSDDASTTLTVNNVAPTLTGLSATAILEDETTTLSGTIADQGTLDTFTVDIDWDNDGTVDETHTGLSAGPFSYTHQYLDDDPTSTPVDNMPISVTVTDDDTGSVTAGTTVEVSNVAPVIDEFTSSSLACGGAAEGHEVTVLASFSDAGTLDTHTATIDWGNGTVTAGAVSESGGSGTVSGAYSYPDGGVYQVTITLTDDDSGSAVATTTMVITGAGVNNGVLYVVGTNEDDQVTVNQQGNGLYKVHASFFEDENFKTFNVDGVDLIYVILCCGNDQATIAGSIVTTAILDGGGGDDQLNGGGGSNVLLGGAGADKLIGGGARDILIGGLGSDRLVGNGEDDIFIGGTTDYDSDCQAGTLANDVALLEIVEAWNSEGDLATRKLALEAWLNDTTVEDDGEEDTFTGSSGEDWFFEFAGDVVTDGNSNSNGNGSGHGKSGK